MKKVLIVTYYWPPGSNPGVLRMLKFCKYLPEFGWQPLILTVKDGSYPSIDHSLEAKIPEGVKVFKTSSLEPFRLYNLLSGKRGNKGTVGMANIKDSKGMIQKFSLFVRANFFIPDARVGWVKYAKKKAEKIIESENIDVVLTTGPPQSTHLTGLHVKRKLGTPWVMDLRDPWTNIYYNEFLPRTALAEKKDRQLEAETSRQADYITTVSKGLEQEFEKYNKNIKLIYNGFDTDDFDFTPSVKFGDKFRVCFFGNLLPNQDIPGLWRGMRKALDENNELAKTFELVFIGNVHEDILTKLRGVLPQERVVKQPFMAHSEAVKEMSAASVLLFIIPDSKDNELILTGKLFEYLASGSDILAVGPAHGNAAEVLDKTGRGKMLSYEDEEGIRDELVEMFERHVNYTNDSTYEPDEATLFYSRKTQTRRLSEVFNDITA